MPMCQNRGVILSPPAWEAGIEIRINSSVSLSIKGRLPHGRRGLKYLFYVRLCLVIPSPPAWEAGIEIVQLCQAVNIMVSPPAWEAGIEILEMRGLDAMGKVASRMGGGD